LKKLSDIVFCSSERKSTDLNEAGLGGMSRSAGKPSWDTYVVPAFVEGFSLQVEQDSFLFDSPSSKANKIASLDKWETVILLSTELVSDKFSKFARIKTQDDVEGWININNLRKPSARGGQSKEYTPDKFGFQGKEIFSAEEVLHVIQKGWLTQKYSNDEVYQMILDSIDSISNASFSGSTTISFSRSHDDVSTKDLMILSKNFGEVLAALYVLSNPEVLSVSFPSDISQMLFDFAAHSNKGIQLFSVKSFGGSSTSIDNLNFILSEILIDDLNLQGFEQEIEDVELMMKTLANEKLRTVDVIERTFLKMFPSQANKLAEGLKNASQQLLGASINLSNEELLTQGGLDVWLKGFHDYWDDLSAEEQNEERTESINELAVMIRELTDKVLEGRSANFEGIVDILSSRNQRTTQHGYLLYPMGSFIVKRLNESSNHLKVLNTIANAGNIIQATVKLYKDKVEIVLSHFADGEFRFSYNAGAKYPSNRPLGFKKVK
jgi:hypothetical protein